MLKKKETRRRVIISVFSAIRSHRIQSQTNYAHTRA